jgi:hypothetical protein
MDFALIVPIVTALTQVFKQFGFTDRLTPVFAILAGIAVVFMNGAGSGVGVWEGLLQGVVAGLSATGLYEVAKTSVVGK